MKPQYEPKRREQKLGYFVEEAGEVLAAVGKTIRWGLDSYNPELPESERETNREWIRRELQDLKGAIERLEGLLEPAAPPEAYDKTFGDDRECACGHRYYLHFDTFEEMRPVGCNYCSCGKWTAPEAKPLPLGHEDRPGWRWESPRWIPTHAFERNAFVDGCAHDGLDGFHCGQPESAHRPAAPPEETQ